MDSELQTGRVYTDFQGLNALKAEAREGAPEALAVAAKQFEAYLVQQLLRASREANPEGGLVGDSSGGLYEDMFDKQVALNVTAGRGLGVAELLVRQLQGGAPATVATAGDSASPRVAAAPSTPVAPTPAPAAPRSSASPSAPVAAAATPVRPSAPDPALPLAALFSAVAAEPEEGTAAGPTPARFSNGADFVRAVMPHARRVAAELGVDPRLLVAQAALETGWGRSIIRNADGTSSHNLFNIKAHRSWSGPVATVRTREYLDGAATMVRDAFRSYDSFEASFRDYVDFLRTNPRYSKALAQTHDPASFARSLQAAGYATDPGYANKILSIFGDQRITNVTV
jgi:flagellar protein FlgJ